MAPPAQGASEGGDRGCDGVLETGQTRREDSDDETASTASSEYVIEPGRKRVCTAIGKKSSGKRSTSSGKRHKAKVQRHTATAVEPRRLRRERRTDEASPSTWSGRNHVGRIEPTPSGMLLSPTRPIPSVSNVQLAYAGSQLMWDVGPHLVVATREFLENYAAQNRSVAVSPEEGAQALMRTIDTFVDTVVQLAGARCSFTHLFGDCTERWLQ